MTADSRPIEVRNGDHCVVTRGVHAGQYGTVEDWRLSKTGHATITVRMPDGDRFKTLAKNVELRPRHLSKLPDDAA